MARRATISTCVALGAAALGLCGCSQPPGVIFPAVANAPRWPAPPEPARIVYVGQLATDADLKPGKSFLELLGEGLFGRNPSRSMLSPAAVCTDDADRVFVADSNAQVVHVFDLATRRYERWEPTGSAAKRFSQPVGVAWDPGGRLLVSDSAAGVVFTFDSDGRHTGQIGAGILQRPVGVAVSRASRHIAVADSPAHQVAIFSPDGVLHARLGGPGRQPGQFNRPTYVAIDQRGRLYVSDSLNFRVQVFAADLQPLRTIGKLGDMPGYFSTPKGVAVDGHDHLYVVDAQFEAVQIFNRDGALLLNFGEEGRGPGQFWLPNGIFIDQRSRIWVADPYNRRIQVFDYKPEGAS